MAKSRAKPKAAKDAEPTLADAVPPSPAAPPTAPLTAPKLDEIIGQRGALEVLSSAVRSARVHHAWIFHGPPGVGKFTAARAFASRLLDPRQHERTDDAARIGAMLDAGTHPDLHVVNKELAAVSRETKTRGQKQSNIAKEVVREFLLEPAALARTVAGPAPVGKVFIVDEAELLDVDTQNALLKTIEEPPAGTVIILVTSDESRLLPTVRSRCQRVAFVPLSPAEMAQWAQRSAAAIPPEERGWLLAYAAGSPGAASVALAHNLYRWHAALEPMLASIVTATSLGSTMAALVEEQAAAAVKGRAEASKEAANRLWARRMLAFVAERYRAALPAAAAHPAQVDRVLRRIDFVQAAERQIGANVQIGPVLENLASQLAVVG